MALATMSVLVVSCAAPDPIVFISQLDLIAPRSCGPAGSIDRLEVQALGDFPLSDDRVENVTTAAATAIDRFPFATEMVVGRVLDDAWSGLGTQVLPADGRRPLVLAEPEVPCPLSGDFDFRSTPGSAVVALEDGSVLIVGGLASSGGLEATGRLIRLPPDLGLSEVRSPQLPVGRTGASATVSDGRVVVAGGARFDDERALATFDVLDSESGELVFSGRPLCPPSAEGCVGRRRDHGAGRLADGRVLLFGGVRRGGGASLREEILDTAAIIDPRSGDVEVAIDASLGDGETIPARRLPQIVTLDSGETYVIGGQGEGGGWTGTAYRFDPSRNGFDRVSILEADGGRDRFVLPFERGVAVPLPGARIAYLTDGPSVTVLLFDGPVVVRRIEQAVTFEGLTNELTQVRAAALPDGRVYVTGFDGGLGEARAYRLDLGSGEADALPYRRPGTTSLPPAQAPEHVIAVHHGAIVEVGLEGGIYRRVSVRTPFDNPPTTLLPTDREWLAYDAASGWVIQEDGASPTRAATVSLAGLRLRDLSIRLDAAAGVDLVLGSRANPHETRVRFRDGSAEVGLCSLRWDGGPVTVDRTGDELLMQTEDGEQACRVNGLSERVAVHLALQPSAQIRSVQLERR